LKGRHVLEQWHILTLEAGPRPALILDVSESALPYWPVFRSLTEGVLESLAKSSQPHIYFLGNPQSYDAAEFAGHGEQWFAENSGRGSIIGPNFDALSAEPEMAVAVVGSGRIFDLPDWQREPIAARTTWCKYGPNGMTGGAYSEESLVSEQLAERLNNPAVRIEIGGAAVMPVFWDDPSFYLEGGRLIGEKTAGSLRVGVLTPEENRLAASVILTDGTRRSLKIETCDMAAMAAWAKLPNAEFNLIRQALRKSLFQCPVCSGEHPGGTWRCPRENDRPLFPTIERLGKIGFAIIDSGAWEARVRFHPCTSLQLNSQTVAVRRADGGADVLRFDAETEQWKVTEKIPFFYWMDDKLHALVV
jgi:hypothetical protein